MSKAAHLVRGSRGEDFAARLLRNLGLEILLRNYRGPTGEIDIIAREGAQLCFVEVKTRDISSPFRPIDAISPEKIWRIVRTAERYLRQLGHPSVVHRFDVVELMMKGNSLVEARYWRDELHAEDARRPGRLGRPIDKFYAHD
ncbi:MAG: putative endonuclease [Rhodothermales bacterium]|jgi:putative endonuclease